ncbi:MAG TPA: autotransporter domain-containing protein, partial [Candidatus Spyradosoma merdigallinarum]|nr:autotransporter domain-containing protein [Candidatus Spyradosoma merdigallinarum]
ATLSGGVSLTHSEGAVLTIAGTLALNADAGKKVTLGGGKVVLAPTAKLDLGGNAASGAAQTQTLFADATNASSALGRGATVTIFEGGNVEGDAVAFLATDSTLSALASQYAVIYDKTNGLTVQTLTNPEAFANGVDTSDLSASFVAWSLGDLADELETLPAGFTDAAQLGALGGGNDPLLNALLAGDTGTARSILDRLSPKSYAAMIAMPVETFHDDVRSIAARLEQRRHDAAAGVDGDWQFFAQAQMISVENDTASDAPTFDFDRYGALAGADVKLDETTLLGVAVGAGTGDADIHNGGGKIESTDFRALAYFGKTFAERFYVNAGAQLGFASYDVKRRSDYGDANADVDGWNAGAFAEAGAAFAISETHGLYATPYVGLAYAHAETDSFTESGSARAAFDADALEGDSLRARIGCAFSWDFALASTAVRLGLDVAYSRELLDDEIDVDVRSGSDEISETAAALPEDVFSIGPTLDVALTASASVYAGYAFNAGTDSSTAHSANVGFRMRF